MFTNKEKFKLRDTVLYAILNFYSGYKKADIKNN